MAKKKTKKPSPRRLLKTSREIAEYRQVSERTVATWISEGCPRPPLTVAKLDQWCIDHGKGKRYPVDGDEAEINWRKRKLAAEAEYAELKTGERKLELVSVEIVLSRVLPYLGTIKMQLEQLPDRLLPYLGDAQEFRRQAQREIETMLEQLADAAADIQQLEPE